LPTVIEHGVNFERFFKETSRILRNGAVLYLSTDNWEPKIDTTGILAFNSSWTIFSKNQILGIIVTASRAGFELASRDDPSTSEPVVWWMGKEYTFISMRFTLKK
jgi:hypothetical protein